MVMYNISALTHREPHKSSLLSSKVGSHEDGRLRRGKWKRSYLHKEKRRRLTFIEQWLYTRDCARCWLNIVSNLHYTPTSANIIPMLQIKFQISRSEVHIQVI